MRGFNTACIELLTAAAAAPSVDGTVMCMQRAPIRPNCCTWRPPRQPAKANTPVAHLYELMPSAISQYRLLSLAARPAPLTPAHGTRAVSCAVFSRVRVRPAVRQWHLRARAKRLGAAGVSTPSAARRAAAGGCGSAAGPPAHLTWHR